MSLFQISLLDFIHTIVDFSARYEKKNPTLATNKLQTIFKLVLLRRKKDSQLDGKRLIELPDKTVTLQKLEFTEEERAIYQMVHPDFHDRNSR